MRTKIITASFVRPDNTTQYDSGDLVANSTSAGAVLPLVFAKDVVVGSLFIRKARLIKTETSLTNASFRLHLFDSSPVFGAGDNAALDITGADGYLGCIEITVDFGVADGAVGFGVPVTGSEISVNSDASSLYGVLEANGSYTPGAEETFTLILETHAY